jgi:hypothetical protein
MEVSGGAGNSLDVKVVGTLGEASEQDLEMTIYPKSGLFTPRGQFSVAVSRGDEITSCSGSIVPYDCTGRCPDEPPFSWAKADCE